MTEDGEAKIKANIVEYKEEVIELDQDELEDVSSEIAVDEYETLTVIHGEKVLIDQKVPIKSGYNGMD